MSRVTNRIAICALILSALSERSFAESTLEQCGLDELNHSTLVECNKCYRSGNIAAVSDANDQIDWPAEQTKITLIHSSRAGKRFTKQLLPNLNRKVDAKSRLLDINTTISVKSASASSSSILGLGCTLNANGLASSIEDDSLERIYGILFDDLFGTSNFAGARMSFVRLEVGIEFRYNLTRLLIQLDAQLARVRTRKSDSSRLKIIIHPAKSHPGINSLAAAISQHSGLSSVELWGLVVDHEELDDIDQIRSLHRSLPATCRLLAVARLSEAPTILNWTERNQKILGGLLMKSEASVPYEVLDYVSSHVKEGFSIITLGRDRPQTKLHGDWSNAHELAIEILNHLNHGSNGFIESHTVSDLNSESRSLDGSIYSLLENNPTHFKGPMFYAIGHFSKYLTAGRQLNHELFTQPNMFSSHFSSFKTHDDQYIVSVVLNGNEHKQPFSWEIDGTIVANTLLDPKSFNTFIIKTITQK